MLGDAMWSPFILTINITTMENKYWHNIPDNDDDDDDNEEEELDALALAKAKKEQDILDEMEEDNNDNT